MATNRKTGRADEPMNEVQDEARHYADLALKTLGELCKSPKIATRARVSASNAILDRAFGKPQSAIEDAELAEKVLTVISDQPMTLEEWKAKFASPEDPYSLGKSVKVPAVN